MAYKPEKQNQSLCPPDRIILSFILMVHLHLRKYLYFSIATNQTFNLKRLSASKDKLTTWVHEYSDDLVNWASYKTKDRALAEDLVQETFISAHKNINRFEEKSSPKTWLFSILRNKIADTYRNKIQQYTSRESDFNTDDNSNLLERFFNQHNEWNSASKPNEWNSDEEELLDNEDFNLVLKACFENLNEKSFLSIQYKYLKGKNGKEICQELDITPSNFWQLLHRAKLQVRECVEGNWFIH